ncbi:unnamed protein product, partial [Protopolystoma xenopodis]
MIWHSDVQLQTPLHLLTTSFKPENFENTPSSTATLEPFKSSDGPVAMSPVLQANLSDLYDSM